MIPCLYGQDEKQFLSNGIGKLSDAISCSVNEKRNGSYELSMTYPVEGIHANNLIEENIIVAKPSEHGDPQPFRIYKINTPLNGILEISARHIQYQQNQISVSPFTAHGAKAAMSALKTNAASDCPFDFQTDITKDDDFTLTVPSTIRNCLGNMDGSILELYGGEFEWDGFTTILHANRGADHGVRIVYGKNLIDFQMEKSIETMVTGVHPYWYKKDDDTETETLIELPEKIMTLDLGQAYEKIEVLDCSSIFTNEPTLEDIRSYARWYLQDEKFSRPDADITVNFAMLWQTPGYEDIAEAETVSLCDTVHVFVTKLNAEISFKVTETDYDVLLEKYKSIVLSNTSLGSKNKRNSFVTGMVSIKQEASSAYRAASSNANKIKQLSHEFEDTAKGLTSSLEMNAAHLRTEFVNEIAGLRSRFEETAEHFQWQLTNTELQLNSRMELTAENLEIRFDDKLNGLRSDFDLTAQHLQTTFEDEINQQSSHFELTAARLETTFDDKLNGLRSDFDLTAQHLQTTFEDEKTHNQSMFEQTANQIQTAVGNISWVEDRLQSVEGSYAYMNDSSVGTLLGKIYVDENGDVIIKKGSGLKLEREVTQNGETYTASFGVWDENNLTAGIVAQQIANDRNILKIIADEINVEAPTINLTSNAVIKAINDGAGSGETQLTIDIDKVNVNGLVTATEFNTQKARIDNLMSLDSTATILKSNTIYANTLYGGNVQASGYFQTIDYPSSGDEDPVSQNFWNSTLKFGNNSALSRQFLASGNFSLGLEAIVGTGTNGVNDGEIRIQFADNSGGTKPYANFKIADTKACKDAVSAARDGVYLQYKPNTPNSTFTNVSNGSGTTELLYNTEYIFRTAYKENATDTDYTEIKSKTIKTKPDRFDEGVETLKLVWSDPTGESDDMVEVPDDMSIDLAPGSYEIGARTRYADGDYRTFSRTFVVSSGSSGDTSDLHLAQAPTSTSKLVAGHLIDVYVDILGKDNVKLVDSTTTVGKTKAWTQVDLRSYLNDSYDDGADTLELQWVSGDGDDYTAIPTEDDIPLSPGTYYIRAKTTNSDNTTNSKEAIFVVESGGGSSESRTVTGVTAELTGTVSTSYKQGGKATVSYRSGSSTEHTLTDVDVKTAVLKGWLDSANAVDMEAQKSTESSFYSIKGQTYASGIEIEVGQSIQIRAAYKTSPDATTPSYITRKITAKSSGSSGSITVSSVAAALSGTVSVGSYENGSTKYTQGGTATVTYSSGSPTSHTLTSVDVTSAALKGWTEAALAVDMEAKKSTESSFYSIKGQGYSSGIEIDPGTSIQIRAAYKTSPDTSAASYITRTIKAKAASTPTTPTVNVVKGSWTYGNITFSPSSGSGTSESASISLKTSTSSGKTTVEAYDGSSKIGVSTLVDASDSYISGQQDGWNDGVKSVYMMYKASNGNFYLLGDTLDTSQKSITIRTVGTLFPSGTSYTVDRTINFTG